MFVYMIDSKFTNDGGGYLMKIKEKKTPLVFFGILFFSIQSLVFVIQYKINYPYSMDYLATDYIIDFLQSGEFSWEQLVQPHAGHHLIFPRLIAIPNLLLNSFDVGNFFIFQWVFFSVALLLIYLILKKTDQRLIWLMIPISAFIYSPLQSSNYWAFAIWLWLIPPIAIMGIIHLLNNQKINYKIFSFAIVLAIISTFSSIIGVIAWIPGLIMILTKNQSKKWFVIWVISVAVVGGVYYSSVPHNDVKTTPELVFTPEGYGFIATFVAVAFRLKYDILMDIVGTFSIILSAIMLWYFIKIKKVQAVIPWIMFLVIGITSAIITGIGRIYLDFHIGNEPYYIPVAHFTQIGLLVLISIIILELKNKKKENHKIISATLFTIIIVFSIMLIPSYVAGWNRGEIYFEEKNKFLECFMLSSNIKCTEDGGVFKKDLDFENINYLLENDLSIFGERNFNESNLNELAEFKVNLQNKELQKYFGGMELMNKQNIDEKNKFNISEPIVIFEGNGETLANHKFDEIIILLNSEPFLKSEEFYEKNSESDSKFRISFLSGYFPKGCYELELIGVSKGEIFSNEKIYQVCK